MLFTLCCLINFDSVLKYAFWIRYPSKSGRPAVLYNNLTAPFEASQELWELLLRGQHRVGGYTCRDSSALLFWVLGLVQTKNWVSTMLV